MGRALVKVELGDSHMSELNYPDDKRIRSERRWRRREAMNDSLKYNCFTSATKTTVMNGENMAALNAKNDHTIDLDADEDNVNNLSANTGEDDDKMDEDHGNMAALIDKNDHVIECDAADEDNVNNLSANTGEDDDEMGEDHGNTAALIDKNDHTIDDEADEDYAEFLSTYTGEEVDETDEDYGNTDALIDKNNQTIDDDADEDYMKFLSGYTSEDDDETDEDYRSFLTTYDPDILTDCSSNHNGGSNGNNSGSDETDADYAAFLPTYNPDDSGIDCASNHSGSNIDVNFDDNTGREDVGEGCSYFPNQSVSDHISDGVGVDEDDQLLGKSSSVRRNSLVSDQEFDTPEVQFDVDEDYEQFLNSVTIVDDDKEYFRDKNTTNTSNVEDENNSSDSDLIILDSYPICENTPFVSSKTYDTSCFGDKMNPEDNNQIAAYDLSEFRKRLMECLDRPYDQKEYDELLLKASKHTKKERHLETRRGVVKAYYSKGLSKSYLDMYPGRSISFQVFFWLLRFSSFIYKNGIA
ncbi:hypothetical protein MTR_1g026790 [Medicago truncatula]|uniref:Uncharacterized protein n=1 Tax=Medicago truncatula TaxID=3880 RepID=A0A072VE39_MEDTR|nr:hypothetical protein MTR_1g026790 [Medicago truncatula]